jgi:hypothetical protein
VIDLAAVRERGVERAAQDALTRLLRPELNGFDSAVNPVVASLTLVGLCDRGCAVPLR